MGPFFSENFGNTENGNPRIWVDVGGDLAGNAAGKSEPAAGEKMCFTVKTIIVMCFPSQKI